MSKDILFEGPDMSVYQGLVDMKRVRDAGCKIVWLRAGYGKNNVDQRYVPNAEACYNLGVPVNIYWFSYAYTEDMARNEADYAIEQAKKYWTSCPIAYDFEYDSTNYARKNGVNVTRELATGLAISFLKRVKDAGYIPVLYTNDDYTRNYFDVEKVQAEVGGVYIWYARYATAISDSEIQFADAWQYTSTGTLPGVTGNVDLNKFYIDFSCAPIPIEQKSNKCNINILDFQKAVNSDGIRDMNGDELAEDGMDGPKTQFVRRKIFMKAIQSGGTYKVGSSGNVVKWWQQRCNEILARNQAVDGLYGKIARADTIALQEKLGLAVDGIAGYNSIQSAFYN